MHEGLRSWPYIRYGPYHIERPCQSVPNSATHVEQGTYSGSLANAYECNLIPSLVAIAGRLEARL